MAQGKWKRVLLGIQGLVGHKQAPDWGFIYRTSTVRDEKWNIGDSVELPDGRVYRYGLSTTALITPMGCQFVSPGVISYTSAVIAAAIGDREVTVPAATHAAAFAKDELRGGYVTIFKAGVIQFRGIIGNDYSAINAAVTLYLDGDLDATITTSSAYEVFGNPYRYLQQSAGSPNLHGFAGPPAVAVSAAAMFFWVQTQGPTFINPQSTLISNEGTGGCWRGDGSLEATATALGGTIPSDDTSQIAGYRMGGNATDAGPLFMLQG